MDQNYEKGFLIERLNDKGEFSTVPAFKLQENRGIINNETEKDTIFKYFSKSLNAVLYDDVAFNENKEEYLKRLN